MTAALKLDHKINYGPLTAFFKSQDITEIMVNSWSQIFVEHKGLLVKTQQQFASEKEFNYLIQSIIDGCTTNEKSFQLAYNGVLPEGYRFNITMPPLTPKGCTLTIRTFSQKIFSFDDLVSMNSITDKAAIFLKEAIQSRVTIVVSGGTGTGKTSLLNTFSLYIPESERVVSIEDTAELRSPHPNWINIITTKSQLASTNARECLMNSLRMRPDRIIIGECRGAEAYDFLQAINTGHEGSMTSIHANTAVDALSRLENLVTLGHSEIPLKYLRKQMTDGISIIVQLRRQENGERKISEIIELTGMEQDTITRAVIFELNKKTKKLEPTGYVPYCLSMFKENQTNVNSKFFSE